MKRPASKGPGGPSGIETILQSMDNINILGTEPTVPEWVYSTNLNLERHNTTGKSVRVCAYVCMCVVSLPPHSTYILQKTLPTPQRSALLFLQPLVGNA
jgi:hypothetical protein